MYASSRHSSDRNDLRRRSVSQADSPKSLPKIRISAVLSGRAFTSPAPRTSAGSGVAAGLGAPSIRRSQLDPGPAEVQPPTFLPHIGVRVSAAANPALSFDPPVSEGSRPLRRKTDTDVPAEFSRFLNLRITSKPQ